MASHRSTFADLRVGGARSRRLSARRAPTTGNLPWLAVRERLVPGLSAPVVPRTLAVLLLGVCDLSAVRHPRRAGPLVLAATQERGDRGAHCGARPDHLGSALVRSSRRLGAAVWCAGDRARTSAAIRDLVRAGSGGLPG